MWDAFILAAMNERVAFEQAHHGVVRTEVMYDLGRHGVVDVKHYADGHCLFTCRVNNCQALNKEDLSIKDCASPSRPVGW